LSFDESDSDRLLRTVARIAITCLLCTGTAVLALVLMTFNAERWVDHSRIVIRTARHALELAVDRETGLRGYLLSGDQRNLEPERAAARTLRAVTDSLEMLTADNPAQRRRARDVAHAIDRWNHEFAAPVLSGQVPAKGDFAGKPLFDDVRRRVRDFIQQEDELYSERHVSDARMRAAVVATFAVESIVFAVIFAAAYARTKRQGRALEIQNKLLEEQTLEVELQATELQEQAAALSVSEMRYRSLFERLPFGVVLQRGNGSYEIGNAAGARILDVPTDALQMEPNQRRSWGVVRLDGSPFPSEELPGLLSLQTRRRESDVVGIVRTDRPVMWLNVSAQPVDEDSTVTPLGAIVSFIDITAQIHAEESLRESSALFEALLQASPIAIVALDQEFRVTAWNAGAERLYGWTRDEVMGERTPLVPEEEQSAALQEHAELIELGHVSDQRRVRQRKDGTLIAVSVSEAVLRDDANAIVGVVTVGSDLTDRERLEADLRQAQKMEAVGQLAGGVAHDFNNLLTIILSYAEIRLSDSAPGSEIATDLREISDAATRAAGLTRQLLTFSRRQVLATAELSLNDVLDGITPMLGRLLGSMVELTLERAPELWTVSVDRGQIEQVIMNLAVNARDAMREGGKLTIRTANLEVLQPDPQTHGDLATGRYVTMSVSDGGRGMDAHTLSHMFEPFFTTKPAGEGTGLGLATVYGIVKQSQGSIQVESEVDKGTTFRVCLPVTIAAAPRVEPAIVTDGSTRPYSDIDAKITILVVEDVAAIRNLSRAILERQGHVVVEAEHGEAALRLIAAAGGAIDLVISDIEMPQMGGLELMRRLGELHPHIPIMLVSGYSNELLLRRGVLSRRVAFLEKPYTPTSLVDAVTEVRRKIARERLPTLTELATRPLVAIVDDTELNRILASAILEDICLVMNHAGGVSTVADLARRVPVLILLDIDMPVLDGFQILLSLREHPTLRFTPVIAFTARTSEADRALFAAAGFDGYIAKPIADFDAFRADVGSRLKRAVVTV
jgi:PAS domain S-box-containing protein